MFREYQALSCFSSQSEAVLQVCAGFCYQNESLFDKTFVSRMHSCHISQLALYNVREGDPSSKFEMDRGVTFIVLNNILKLSNEELEYVPKVILLKKFGHYVKHL